MTMRVAVIGSGPTGIAAATVLTEQGIAVDLLDGGSDHEDEAFAPNLREHLVGDRPPTSDHRRILRGHGSKENLVDALARWRALAFGRIPSRWLQKPILGSTFTFDRIEEGVPLRGPWLPRSLAIGGLANVWGAACYPLRADDFARWPLSKDAMAKWYSRAHELLHVSGEMDALADAYPIHGALQPTAGPAARDPDSVFEDLLDLWRGNRAALDAKGLTGGRSRLAVQPRSRAQGCIRCGLCLSGCAAGAIWNGRQALENLKRSRLFTHMPGSFVRVVQRGPVDLTLAIGWPDRPQEQSRTYDAVFLAAGALSSFRIAAQSQGMNDAKARVFDNDIFVMPFRLANGKHRDRPRFTLSEAAIAISPGAVADRAAHLQLYRLSDSLAGPLGRLTALPHGLGRLAGDVFGRYALGFLYFHSDDSRAISVQLAGNDTAISGLQVSAPAAPEAGLAARRTIALLRGAAPLLGLRPIPFGLKEGEPGLSGHIGGTLPMRRAPEKMECDPEGRLEGMPGVYVVDTATFPEMPAQNPTLTAVANAMRLASGAAVELRRRSAA